MITAIINDEECIGCSRCIPACPVDAIVGTNKFLHEVLIDECIGCKLCVDPCPVDCIEMVPMTKPFDKLERAQKAKDRHLARSKRLQKESQRQLPIYANKEERSIAIKNEISAALRRVEEKLNVQN